MGMTKLGSDILRGGVDQNQLNQRQNAAFGTLKHYNLMLLLLFMTCYL